MRSSLFLLRGHMARVLLRSSPNVLGWDVGVSWQTRTHGEEVLFTHNKGAWLYSTTCFAKESRPQLKQTDLNFPGALRSSCQLLAYNFPPFHSCPWEREKEMQLHFFLFVLSVNDNNCHNSIQGTKDNIFITDPCSTPCLPFNQHSGVVSSLCLWGWWKVQEHKTKAYTLVQKPQPLRSSLLLLGHMKCIMYTV